jgi:hypothetical protein
MGNKPSSLPGSSIPQTPTQSTSQTLIIPPQSPSSLATNTFAQAFAASLSVNIGKALLVEARCKDRSSSSSGGYTSQSGAPNLFEDDSMFGSYDIIDILPTELSPKYSFMRAPRLRLSRPPVATGQLESGWMYKLGAVRKTWKRRFFVVSQLNDNFVVHYYDNEESSNDKRKSRGSILLCGHAIRSLTGLSDVSALENAAGDGENGEEKRLRSKFLSSSLLPTANSQSGSNTANDNSGASRDGGAASSGNEESDGFYLAIEPLDRRHFSRLWFLRCDTLEQRNSWKHALRYASTRCIAPCLSNALPFANILNTAAAAAAARSQSQTFLNQPSLTVSPFELINRSVVLSAFDVTRAQLGLDGYFKLDREGVPQLAALLASYSEFASIQDESRKESQGDNTNASSLANPANTSSVRSNKGDVPDKQKSLSTLFASSFRGGGGGVSSAANRNINSIEKAAQSAAEIAWPAIQSRAEMSAEPLFQLASAHVPQIAAAESARMKEARALFADLLKPICNEMVSSISAAVTGTFLGPFCRAHAEAVTAVWHRLNLIIDRGLREVELRQLFRDAEWQFELLSKSLNELRVVTRAGRTGLPTNHVSSSSISASLSTSTSPTGSMSAAAIAALNGSSISVVASNLLQQLHCTYAELVSILSPLTLFEIESEAEASIRSNTTRAIYSFVLRVEESQEAAQLGDIFGQVIKLMAEDAQERVGESIVTIFLKTLSNRVLQHAIEKIPSLKSWLQGNAITENGSDGVVHSQLNRIVLANSGGSIATSGVTDISGLSVTKKNILAVEAEIAASVTACGGAGTPSVGDLFVSNQFVFVELIEDLIRESVEETCQKDFDKDTLKTFKNLVLK